jgi:pimeloyl-ACP methyl ester carboxylesterase
MSNNSSPIFLQSETLRMRIAYDVLPGKAGSPVLLALHGLHSDRASSKCEATMALAVQLGIGALRLDYPGHGQSSGQFEAFTIGQAVQAAAEVAQMTGRPIIPVGSSTGAWVALLLALRLPQQVRGIVTVANACDFTERLFWEPLSAADKKAWEQTGLRTEPADEGETWRIGFDLIREGRDHLLLGTGKLARITCPVRLLHGMADDVVPWTFSTDVAAELGSNDVQVTLIKDGDHRLKREADIALLEQAITEISAAAQT